MPKRILIIATLFIICGLSAAWDIISALSEGNINLNFAVLTLFTGIDLLRGGSQSRTIAKVWIGIGYIICIILALLAAFSTDQLTYTSGGTIIRGPDAIVPSIIVMLAFVTLLIIIHTALNTPKAIAYCDKECSAEAFQPRQPLLATLRRHPLITALALTSIAGLGYLAAKPPRQSYTGTIAEIVATVTSETFAQKSAAETGTTPHYHSWGSSHSNGTIEHETAHSLEATPEQYNAYFNHLHNAISSYLSRQGATNIRHTVGPSGKGNAAMDLHINYTRGTRQGSIELTTKATPKPALYPYEITIKAEESF